MSTHTDHETNHQVQEKEKAKTMEKERVKTKVKAEKEKEKSTSKDSSSTLTDLLHLPVPSSSKKGSTPVFSSPAASRGMKKKKGSSTADEKGSSTADSSRDQTGIVPSSTLSLAHPNLHYLEHFDPAKWVVTDGAMKSADGGGSGAIADPAPSSPRED